MPIGGPACDPTWIRFRSQQSVNGAQFLGITTVADCLELCTVTPNCVAIDFDTTQPDNPGCWLHMLPEDLWTNNTFHPIPITQYIINRSCLIPGTRAF